MRLALLLLLLGPAAFAHPLDDRAQMASEVVIVSDQRLEYVLHFRYVDALASISEISGKLDGDNDGVITAAELKRRFNLLVDELILPVSIRVDDAPITLSPEFDRFLFQDMNRTGPLDVEAGVPADNLRIHYRFVFSWDAGKSLAPGEHKVEYSFNSSLAVISAITEQMIAFDAREGARHRVNEVQHSSIGLPTMTFMWKVVAASPQPTPEPEVPRPQPMPAPESPPAEPTAPDGSNIPAWLTMLAGIGVSLVGAVELLRARGRKRLSAAIMVPGGVAIALVAAFRLGLFGH
jgi:hypothetical protein